MAITAKHSILSSQDDNNNSSKLTQESNLENSNDNQTNNSAYNREEEIDENWNFLLNAKYPIFITFLFMVQYWSYMLISELGLFKDFAHLLVFSSEKWYQPWRYFTVIFIHQNFDHLMTNVAKQLPFGIALELKYGWKRIAIIYFTGAACGTILHFVCYFEAGAIAFGSSCATRALLCANIPPLIWDWRDHWKYHGNPYTTIIQFVYNSTLILYVGWNFQYDLSCLFTSFHLYFFEGVLPPHRGISCIAHTGGCIGGFTTGTVLLSSIYSPSSSSTASASEEDSSDDMGYEKNIIPLITLVSALVINFA